MKSKKTPFLQRKLEKAFTGAIVAEMIDILPFILKTAYSIMMEDGVTVYELSEKMRNYDYAAQFYDKVQATRLKERSEQTEQD